MNRKSDSSQSKLSHFNIINRGYNARMRDAYFIKIEKSLSEFTRKLKENSLEPDMAILRRLNNELATAVDFSRQSIMGFPLNRPPLKGRQIISGKPFFFKEEILFINLLEELVSSGIFLLNRFNTIFELNSYKDKIQGLLYTPDKNEGYLTKILHFINENQKSEDEEIKQIIALIIERMTLARRIFNIIKTSKGLFQ